MFEFVCPNCGQSIVLSASEMSAVTKCGNCSETVDVPESLLKNHSTILLDEESRNDQSDDEQPMTQAQMGDTTHEAGGEFAPAKDPRVNLVLGQWEKAWRDGVELSPEELCEECPEILPQVIDGIKLLRQVLEAIKQLQSLADNVNFTAYVVPTLSEFPGSEPAELPKIPGYEIVRVLGRGGMGIVYQARQVELQNIVALKMILTRSTAHAKQRERFLREARTVANLHHPHIVQLYQFGHYKNQPFFTLEFMPGGDLADRLEREPLTVAEAVALIEKLAQAIAYAHKQGVVHRDLKPKNILLTDQNIPKVADFGLVKPAEQTGASTDTNIVVGTPPYMPPEQAKALHREVGPAADIYSLGAILYHCLTGRPPFLGPTPVETLKLVIEDEVVPPRRLQPGVSKDVETICLKCLRKEAKQRYASADHLAEDLQCVQAGDPLKYARPVRRAERILKWAKRRPTAATLLLLVTLMTVLAVGGFIYGFKLVVAERDNFEREKKKSDNFLRALKQEQDDAKAMMYRENWFTYGAALREAHLHFQSNNWPASLKSLAKCQWDFRSWMYDRLRFELIDGQEVWRGHRNAVSCMDFSRDGQWLASCSAKSIFIWDVATGAIAQQWPAKASEVRTLAFHPSQQLVAVGRADGVIHLRHVESGKLVRTLADPKGHSSDVLGLRFSADGQWLASAGADRSVGLWDAKTGKLLRTLKGHTAPVHSVAFSPDKFLLLTGSFDNTVKVWKIDARTDKQTNNLALHIEECTDPQLHFTAPVDTVAFHPTNRSLNWFGYDYQFVTASGDAVVVWQIRYRLGMPSLEVHRHQVLLRHTKPVTDVCLSPNGDRLVSASEDGSVVVWDMRTGRIARTFHGHWGVVTCVAVNPKDKGAVVVSAGKDKTIRKWRVDNKRDDKHVVRVGYQLECIAVSHDGKYVASAGANAALTLFDAKQMSAPLASFDYPSAEKAQALPTVLAVAFNRNADRLAAGYSNGDVLVWNVANKKVVASLTHHTKPIRSIVFLARNRIAFAGDQNRIEIWQLLKKPVLERRTAQQKAAIHSLAVSPDGRWLASGTGDNQVRLWPIIKGKFEPLFVGNHSNDVTHVAFSPDGKWLASGGKDRMIKLWLVDSAPPMEPFNLVGHTEQVAGIAFHADNKLLLSMDNNNELLVWHVPTRLLLVRLKIGQFEIGQHAGVPGMALDGSGSSLVFATGRYSIHLWKNGERETSRALAWTNAPVHATACGSLQNWLAAALDDSSIRVWDMRTGKDVMTLLGHEQPVTSVAVHPKAAIVASASNDGDVIVWEADGKRKPHWRHGAEVTGVALSSDGKTLASVGKDGYVVVGPTKDASKRRVLYDDKNIDPRKSYSCLAFSRDDQWLATGDSDGEIALWSLLGTATRIKRLPGHKKNSAAVTALCFSPNGKFLASSSDDGTAKIWSFPNGELLWTLGDKSQSPSRLSCVLFSPDNRWTITAGDDETIKIWRASDGKFIKKLHGHAEKITSAIFSADNEWLVTGDAGGYIQCWRWDQIAPAPSR